MWADNHEFTLIDKLALDVAKSVNDNNNELTPEYGLQMTQTGYDAFVCNIKPSITNVDNSLCVIRGCHVMHKIKYLTLEEVAILIEEWQTQYPQSMITEV